MAFTSIWYFAFVDEGEAFSASVHNRQDAKILGFTFDHEEGNFATLRMITENPLNEGGTMALGLLGPGRKHWCWFSVNQGAGVIPLFHGRLIAIPTDVFGKKITMDFQARPIDFTAQKEALAVSLKNDPVYWDPVFYDEIQRDDPELALESRSAVWYIDPVAHTVAISDILLGEGGTEIFLQSEHRMDGLQLSLGNSPQSAIEVDAEIKWTQRAVGTVSMSLASESFSLDADTYPKAGASFGDGWTVQSALVSEPWSFTVQHTEANSELTIEWLDGDVTSVKQSDSVDGVAGPGEATGQVTTSHTSSSSYSDDGQLTSFNVSDSMSGGFMPFHEVTAEYVIGYDAARPYTEHITYTLTADVQATVTLPDDAEPERIEFRSVDLSELIDGAPPIDDPRRRSYVTQERGYRSIKYTILVARARLRIAARAIDIKFSPYLNRITTLRLDKSATIADWRIPGGTATGKIKKFTCTLTPPTESSGASLALDVIMGCAVGNGGTIAADPGDPEYVVDGYVDPDYHQRTGAVLVFNDEVGFTPPPYAPNDDGIDFINGLQGQNIFEVPVTITEIPGGPSLIDGPGSPGSPNGPASGAPPPAGYATWAEAQMALAQDANAAAIARKGKTIITFKLRDLKKEFEKGIPLTVTELKIPTMINLSATA